MKRFFSNYIHIDFGVVLFTFCLFLVMVAVIFRTAADVIREAMYDAESQNIKAIATLGAELHFPYNKELRLTSHNFADKSSWSNPESSEYIWKPPSGKTWIVMGILFLIDDQGEYPNYMSFNYGISGEIVIQRKYYKILDNAIYADSASMLEIGNKKYLLFRWNYRIPLVIRSTQDDFIRVYTGSNQPIKAEVCKVTLFVVERDDKNSK